MMKAFTNRDIDGLVQLSEEEFLKEEEKAIQQNRGFACYFSMFAIAIHIVLCVEVFSYENTASKACSIVGSVFFILQHCYNSHLGCGFNLCCSLPICITGFALSNVKLINTLAFTFQLCVWMGEFCFFALQHNVQALMKQRPREKPETGDQNNKKQVINIDGFQFSNTQQQEIKNDLNELASLLHNGLQQINHQQKLQQLELAEQLSRQQQNPNQQN